MSTGERRQGFSRPLAGLSRYAVLPFVFCLALANSAVAQWMGKQTDCYTDSIAANPNRPTVSNPAHVTQYGVLELEYGWDRFWPEEHIHQATLEAC